MFPASSDDKNRAIFRNRQTGILRRTGIRIGIMTISRASHWRWAKLRPNNFLPAMSSQYMHWPTRRPAASLVSRFVFLPGPLLALTVLAATSLAANVPGDTIPVGVVYNIFHEEYATDADFFRAVDRDIPAIAAAHFDHVFIFPMSEWDSATRSLKWERTDYLVRKLEEQHLKFVPLLFKEEQCSHYFPIWKFRELGLWNEHDRNNGDPNNRENVDFADPRVFPLLAEYIRAVAGRYGKSPALSFYNLWNEPHYSSTAPHVLVRFRAWLQAKYHGLAALRQSWGEDYTDWSEVTPFLNDDWNSSMPGIDWNLFRMELNGQLLAELAAVLHAADPDHPINANPVGTPWSGGGTFTGYGTDSWQFTPHEDFAGASYYPDAWAREQGLTRAPLWFHNLNFTVFRSAAGEKDFILTELYTNAKTGLTLGGYLDAPTARQVAWAALANDCKGLFYWKWQPFRRGRQSLGRGLVGLDGELAPRGAAVRDVAAVIRQFGPLLRAAQPAAAEVGIIIDQRGLLKLHLQTAEPRMQSFMQQSVAGLFRSLDGENIQVDLLRADLGLDPARLKRYKILFLPFQIVMRHDLIPLLHAYVDGGGWLVADARCAAIDELDFAYAPDASAGLDKLFGTLCKDWVASPGNHLVRLLPNAPATGEIAGRYFREQLRLQFGSVVLATFADNNDPALVAHQTGRGMAMRAAFPLGGSYSVQPDQTLNRLILSLCAQAGVNAPARFVAKSGSTPMIRVQRAQGDCLIYVLNQWEMPLEGELILTAPVPAGVVTELLSGANISVTRNADGLHLALQLEESGVRVFHVSP